MSAERGVELWAPVRALGTRQQLAAIWMFLKRDLLLQTHFRVSYLTNLMETVSQLAIYGVIASLGQHVARVEQLTGGYVNFVISGLVLNTLLATALAGPYLGLMESFWNNRIEIIMASPLKLPWFVTGISVGKYVDALVRVAILLAGGTIFLGFVWPPATGLLGFLVVLVLALAATTGLGLAAAGMVYTLDARGGQDPVRFVVETIAGLVAGVYFPLQVLPAWMQWLGYLIPHTYAIDGMRRALFGSSSLPPLPLQSQLPLPPLLTDLIALTLYAAIALPLGWWTFKRGMALARSDGRLSRWL